MSRLALALVLLLVLPAAGRADPRELASTPAVRLTPEPTYAPPPPRHVVHGPLTPAMRVWIMHGVGPAGRVRALGLIDVEVAGDADAAIDLLQTRAFALHADAVIRVRIEHTADGATHVSGMAIRYT